jgi:hypothetical protein
MNGWTGTATLSSGDVVFFRSQDTWTGAPSASWNAAILECKEGVAYIGGGTYNSISYGSGTRATFKATGDYIAPYAMTGIIKADKSNVVIQGFNVDGDDYRTSGISVGWKPSSDITNILIDDCKVHDTSDPPGQSVHFSTGIVVGPNTSNVTVSYVTVQNCEIYNTHTAVGLQVYPSWGYTGTHARYITIRNNEIHNTAPLETDNGAAIYIKDDAQFVTVEYNYLHDNFMGILTATHTTAASGAPDNLTIRYNIISNNFYCGMDMMNAAAVKYDSKIYGNIFYDNGSTGVETLTGSIDLLISPSTAGWGSSTINICNNTFRNTNNLATYYKFSIHLGNFGGSAVVTDAIINFKNNIVYTESYPAIWDSGGTTMTHDHNLIYRGGTAGAVIKTGINNVNVAWYGGAGNPPVSDWETTGLQTSNPNFTGGTLPTGFTGTYGVNMVPNTDYFSIASGNAIGNGATLGYPYNGCINQAGYLYPGLRPAGSYDIGAYQNPSALLSTVPTLLGGTCQGCILTQ